MGQREPAGPVSQRARAARAGVVLLVVLACALYAWQLGAAWADEVRTSRDPTGHAGVIITLNASGLASGAAATLSSDGTARGAVLQLYGMPQLPAGQVYQLWCVTGSGEMDGASTFQIQFDGHDSMTQVAVTECRDFHEIGPAAMVRAMHRVEEYRRFMVTIEPDGGSRTPTGPVVLSN
jgi:anti-sigma-K factor RskA